MMSEEQKKRCLVRLQHIIAEKNYSMRRFEQECGLANGTVHRWFRTEREPTPAAVLKIADRFHKDFEYLYGITEDENEIKEVSADYVIEGLGDDENLLIETYRKMNASDRMRLMMYLGKLS